MTRRIVEWGIVFWLAGWVTQASAQVTAEGRAFGTLVSVLQLPALTIRTGDTGQKTVTAPGSFSKGGSAKTLDASPLAIVINDVTSTDGQANLLPNECTSLVNSVAGSSTAIVLPGTGPAGQGLIEVAASGSNASVTGSGAPSGNGQIAEVVINGNRIDLPSPQPPNTTLLAGLNLLTFNRQVSSSDPVAGNRSMLVQALRAQLVSSGEVLDVVLSESDANLIGLPASCFVPCAPDLTNSNKSATFVKDTGNTGMADPGDIIQFTISAINSALCGATGLQIIDRIPFFVTVDTSSIKLDNTPVPPTAVVDCPASADFDSLCPGEKAVDTSRKCIVVDLGDLPAKTTKKLTYNVTVNNDLPQGANICNAAKIGSRPVVDIVQGGVGITAGGGDVLRTTGSGGCSVNPSAPSSDGWPILAVGVLLGWRRLRKRAR